MKIARHRIRRAVLAAILLIASLATTALAAANPACERLASRAAVPALPDAAGPAEPAPADPAQAPPVNLSSACTLGHLPSIAAAAPAAVPGIITRPTVTASSPPPTPYHAIPLPPPRVS